jgi:lipopolysaccharide assembly outer membrane protein LptD (OstA)
MFACLLTCVLVAATVTPAVAERVTTNFDAERVDFSFDRKLVTLEGNAHLFSQVADDPSRYVRITADLIEGDISRGRFEMVGDVRIETPEGAMEGSSAFYNARTAQYSLRRGGLMVQMGEGEGEAVTCGFAYAAEIATEGEIVYMTRGRFTTCSRPRPHYSLEADRFRWNPETQEVVVYGGSIHLYGLEIPVLPEIPYSFGEADRNMPSLLPFPTYTSRDGLRLVLQYRRPDGQSSHTCACALAAASPAAGLNVDLL